MPKNVQTTTQLHSSHMLVNSQNSPSQASTVHKLNFQMFKLVLEQAEEPEIKLPVSTGSLQKQEFKRNIYLCVLTKPKPLTLQITTNCGKFLKRSEYQTMLPASREIYMQVKKQQLELDMEQTGSKQRKEQIKAVYCHPAYLTYMQSTS